MKCPTCIENDQTSTVTSHGSTTTLMPIHRYWDDYGNYHYHDPNTTTENLSCSNGHSWSKKHKDTCISCPINKEDN